MSVADAMAAREAVAADADRVARNLLPWDDPRHRLELGPIPGPSMESLWGAINPRAIVDTYGPPPTVKRLEHPPGVRWLATQPGVYFICEQNDDRSIENRVVKIGHSKNPMARLLEFQTANRRPLVFEALEHDSWPADLESSLHRRFAKLRIHGEWFRVDEGPGSLGEYIDAVRRENVAQCEFENARRKSVRAAKQASQG